MNMTGVYDFDSDMFRDYTLEGKWEEVARIYRTHKQARKIKIDGYRGTALHVAVNDGLEHIVKNLIDILINDGLEVVEVAIDEVENIVDEEEEVDLEHVLKLKNARGDTPLHLAASWGFMNICKLINGQNGERKHLIKERNKSGETPLFLAALSWQKQTFAYLLKQFKDFQDDPLNLQVLIRDLDGDTILHSAIRRELLDLAVIIIKNCPELHDIQNNKGMTPLKLLANRPSAFRSGSKLTWWRQIIYSTIQVQDLDVQSKLEKYLNKNNEHKFDEPPQNYGICYQVFTFGRHLGVKEMRKIKKKHIWGGQLLNALMETPSQSYMGSGGQPIEQNEFEYGDETNPFSVGIKQKEEEEAMKKKWYGTDKKQELQDPDSEEKVDMKETAFLIAAKNGIVEMVRVILYKIPSASYNTTTDKRNVFHVAVENKQPLVVEFLLKNLSSQNRRNLIQAVDKDDNTVLHLAAETLSSETRPGGSAMQMMWEIKWFEYVKEQLPYHFIWIKNIKNKTSGELFKESHKMLVKESSSWLKEISGVVAALVAGVAFATVSTIPGWTEGGKPALEGQSVFDAFAISSLIALVSSVTALILFLSLITSHNQAQDFRRILPALLLSGLTFMFLSIVSMFVSFCSGHFFLLNHKYRQFAFPIYVAACLPLTFYAVAQFPLYLALLNIIVVKVPKPLDI